MRTRPWKWALALGLSGALHAGAAVFLLPGQPEVRIAGGEGTEIALLGNAFADLSMAGTPSETVEPAAETAPAIAPVEPDAAAEPIEAVEVPPLEAVEARTAMPVEEAPSPPVAETSAQPAPAAERPEPQVAEPVPPEQTPVAPETPEAAAAERELAEVEPEEPEEEVVAMVPVPRPTPRPHYEPPEKSAPRQAKAPAPAPKKAARPPAQTHAERSTGSGGRDSRDARRGASDGGRTASTASRGAARVDQAGNAAASNYPGKILARLRRALRYPREARRERLRGEVRVAFTVSRNGAVGAIRVVRSSGSPILDQAAVETVRRAAPFPAIPDGRSSWPFTVPLAFVR